LIFLNTRIGSATERVLTIVTSLVLMLRPLSLVTMFCLGLLLKFLPPDGMIRPGFLLFLGRFHPLAVHLPIAFVLLLPVFEIPLPFLTRIARRGASAVLIFSAFVTLLGAIIFGWLLAYSGGYQGILLMQHAWAAVITGTLLSLAVLFWKYDLPRIVLILASVAGISLTGHLGGELTHGVDYLTEYAPEPIRFLLTGESKIAQTNGDMTVYSAVLAPALKRSCLQCHNAVNANAGLDMSSLKSLMKGGEDGPVIVPGKPDESLMVKRVCLPPDEPKAMPPAPKQPLTSAELSILRAWIASGAKADTEIGDLTGLPLEGRNLVASRRRALRPKPPELADPTQAMPAITKAAKDAGVRIIPLSANPKEGLSLQTFGKGSTVDDSKIAMITAAAPFLVEADLADTKISDKALTTLVTFPNLREVDLSQTTVTGASVSKLLALPHLEVLILTGTSVDDTWLKGIHTGASLRTLGLFQTKVTDLAIDEFRKNHPKLTIYGPINVIPPEHPAPTPEGTSTGASKPSTASTKTALQKLMDTLAEGVKQLSIQVADPTRQTNTISLLEMLKKTASDSKSMDPMKTTSIPAEDKERFLADYRAQLEKLVVAFSTIEVEVKASKYEEAKTFLASLGDLKKEAHSKFKTDATKPQPSATPITPPSASPSPAASLFPSTGSSSQNPTKGNQALSSTITLKSDDEELQKEMKILSESMKELSLSISDPSKKSGNVDLLETMIKATVASAEISPSKAETITASDRGAFLAEYRAELHKLKEALSELEGALKEDQFDRSQTLLQKIVEIKKEGHSKFKE
jgi:soluble cytochrome b562/uncharacterized membrane protein